MVEFLELSEEVRQALSDSKPVVALESTIISHGMPYPVNVQTAKEVENIVRLHGAVPATIAILGGKIKVGLSEQEIERLATGSHIEKVSRRDLAYVLSSGKDGATTVAATMICADLAGIRVFVTGGIGGVHRGAETTMDISADLQELAKTNVAVVCAGAKSILDIGLTLEYLETYGVPAAGYQTGEFPAFYTRNSGFRVNFTLSSPSEAAGFLKTKWNLGLQGGVVIANPIAEKDALDSTYIQGVIEEALKEAQQRQITGKEVTPFLLDRIKQLTGGSSLQANVALVKNNAAVGAQIAAAFAAAR